VRIKFQDDVDFFNMARAALLLYEDNQVLIRRLEAITQDTTRQPLGNPSATHHYLFQRGLLVVDNNDTSLPRLIARALSNDKTRLSTFFGLSYNESDKMPVIDNHLLNFIFSQRLNLVIVIISTTRPTQTYAPTNPDPFTKTVGLFHVAGTTSTAETFYPLEPTEEEPVYHPKDLKPFQSAYQAAILRESTVEHRGPGDATKRRADKERRDNFPTDTFLKFVDQQCRQELKIQAQKHYNKEAKVQPLPIDAERRCREKELNRPPRGIKNKSIAAYEKWVEAGSDASLIPDEGDDDDEQEQEQGNPEDDERKLNPGFYDSAMKTRGKTSYAVTQYKAAIEKHFTDYWNEASAGIGSKDKATERTKPDTKPESVKNDKNLRAFSLPLDRILRPDMAHHRNQIVQLLDDAQRKISIIVQETQIINRKQVLDTSSGSLHGRHKDVDLRDLYRPGFVIRNADIAQDPTLQIAVLSNELCLQIMKEMKWTRKPDRITIGATEFLRHIQPIVFEVEPDEQQRELAQRQLEVLGRGAVPATSEGPASVALRGPATTASARTSPSVSEGALIASDSSRDWDKTINRVCSKRVIVPSMANLSRTRNIVLQEQGVNFTTLQEKKPRFKARTYLLRLLYRIQFRQQAEEKRYKRLHGSLPNNEQILEASSGIVQVEDDNDRSPDGEGQAEDKDQPKVLSHRQWKRSLVDCYKQLAHILGACNLEWEGDVLIARERQPSSSTGHPDLQQYKQTRLKRLVNVLNALVDFPAKPKKRMLKGVLTDHSDDDDADYDDGMVSYLGVGDTIELDTAEGEVNTGHNSKPCALEDDDDESVISEEAEERRVETELDVERGVSNDLGKGRYLPPPCSLITAVTLLVISDLLIAQANTRTSEPSYQHEQRLVSLAKSVWDDSKRPETVDEAFVRTHCRALVEYSQEQVEFTVKILNILTPHWPHEEEARKLGHVLFDTPFLTLANAFLRGAGYNEFLQEVSPISSCGSVHALPLNPSGIYETLCGLKKGRFQTYLKSGDEITDVMQATHSPNAECMFASFFNMDVIRSYCRKRKLEFANRIIYVGPSVIRITGYRLPGDEGKVPVNDYVQDKKNKKKDHKATETGKKEHYKSEVARRQIGREDALMSVTMSKEIIKSKDKEIRVLTTRAAKADTDRRAAVKAVRAGGLYSELMDARELADKAVGAAQVKKAERDKYRQFLRYWTDYADATSSGASAETAEPSTSTMAPSSSSVTPLSTSAKRKRKKVEPEIDLNTFPSTATPRSSSLAPPMTKSTAKRKTTGVDMDLGPSPATVTPSSSSSSAPPLTSAKDKHSRGGSKSMPTLKNPGVQNVVTAVDMTQLHRDIQDNNKDDAKQPVEVSYFAIDRGKNVPSVSTAADRETIAQYSTSHNSLHDEVLGDTPEERRLWRVEKTKEIRFPKPFMIKTGHLRQLAYLPQESKRRHGIINHERNKHIQGLYNVLAENSLRNAPSLDAVDERAAVHRQVRDRLIEFNMSSAIRRLGRHREIQKKQAYQKICADERRHSQAVVENANQSRSFPPLDPTVDQRTGHCDECHRRHDVQWSKDGFQFPSTCPNNTPRYLPVLFLGDQGMCINSRLKGIRMTGNTVPAEHAHYIPVCNTSEHRTSKVCIFCGWLTRQARGYKHVKDSEGKLMRRLVWINGAIECVNKNCIAVRAGYTIRGRDTNAAINILVNGHHFLNEGEAHPLFDPDQYIRTPPDLVTQKDVDEHTKHAAHA
ncbi:hypothetical protein BGZ83_001405, partial [Gryganskiella cystojenkinii]